MNTQRIRSLLLTFILTLSIVLGNPACFTTPAKTKHHVQHKAKVEQVVYITETGSKYHRSGCRYLWHSCIKINKSEAAKEGYTPCSVCNP